MSTGLAALAVFPVPFNFTIPSVRSNSSRENVVSVWTARVVQVEAVDWPGIFNFLAILNQCTGITTTRQSLAINPGIVFHQIITRAVELAAPYSSHGVQSLLATPVAKLFGAFNKYELE